MLTTIWLIAAAVLAAVLGVAGVAKARSPLSVDRAFRDLRVHPRFSRPWMRRAFPWGELALAVGLLGAWGWPLVVIAVAALALMVAYLVLIARALARPEDVVCNCFGGTGDRPIDGLTLARNIALVALATIAVLALLLSADARSAPWPLLLGALVA